MKFSFRVRVVAALVAVWVLWGSTFLGIRIVVVAVPPLLSAGVRFAVAGALLLLIVETFGRKQRAPLRERLRGRLRRLTLLGLLHFLIANGLVSLASQDLPSAATGVYFATVPLWVLAVRAGTGGRPGRRDVAGGLVGLAGVALLAGFEPGRLVPTVLVLSAAAVWAVAGHLGGREKAGTPADARPPLDSFTASAVQMVTGGLALLAAAAAAGEWGRFELRDVTGTVWLAAAHLIVLGSIVGFAAYTWLIRNVEQRLASTYAYVNPVVAVLLGTTLLGEHLTVTALAGAALVVASVAGTIRARADPAGDAVKSVTALDDAGRGRGCEGDRHGRR